MSQPSRYIHIKSKTILKSLLWLSGFALLIFHAPFFLLLFAGIFFAVVLHASATWFVKIIKMPYGFSLVLVLLLIAGVFTVLIMWIGPAVGEQVTQMLDTLPKSLENLKDKITQTSLGQRLFEELPSNPSDFVADKKAILSKVAGSFSATVNTFADVLIVLITGIFLASSPSTYTKGFIKLFRVSFRPRLRQVLAKVHDTLSKWMMAKLLSMVVVGVSTAIGLQLIGLPLPYALALIAGLFSFIPNIGPYLALAPALLIALLEGTDVVLYVLILYFGIQMVESYLITPLIEKKMVALPPALTLMWMVLMGTLTGILGLILAAPLLAALIVLIKELYVKDELENQNISND